MNAVNSLHLKLEKFNTTRSERLIFFAATSCHLRKFVVGRPNTLDDVDMIRLIDGSVIDINGNKPKIDASAHYDISGGTYL